jgi:hypothetical protein
MRGLRSRWILYYGAHPNPGLLNETGVAQEWLGGSRKGPANDQDAGRRPGDPGRRVPGRGLCQRRCQECLAQRVSKRERQFLIPHGLAPYGLTPDGLASHGPVEDAVPQSFRPTIGDRLS